MRLTQISAAGFGQFNGAELKPAPGLTVVRGPNEAGKTTFLAFTRAMLFGFESGHYPALSGGKRGGWLDVEMSDGRSFRIERYGERGGSGTLRIIENDKDLGTAYLNTLLQGVESRVYRNIFAFGLSELTQFGALNDDEVAARIYGAGLGTGSVSGLDVESALRKERDNLFKTGGSNPLINALLKEYEELGVQLRDRDLPREYGEAGAELERVERELEEVNGQHGKLDAERRRSQRIVEGWSTWLELSTARRERDDLGEVAEFEPDALEQLGRLETTLDDTGKALEGSTTAQGKAQESLDAADVDHAVLDARLDLEALAEATRVEVARQTERDRTEQELVEARSQADASVAALGADWTLERVEEFDDSTAVRAEINGRFRTLLDSTDRAVNDARGALKVADERLTETEQQAQATADRIVELEGELEGRAPAATRDRGLREVESLLGQLTQERRVASEASEDDLAAAREDLDERRLKAADLSRAVAAQDTIGDALAGVSEGADSSGQAAWQTFLAPIVLAIASIVVAAVAVLADLSILIAGGSLVVGLGGAGAWAYVLRGQGPSDAETTRTRLQEQLDESTATTSRLGSDLGLGDQPTPADVDRYLSGLEEERRELEQAEDRQEHAEAAAREVDRLESELATTATAIDLPAEPSPADIKALDDQVAADRKTEAGGDGLREREAQLRTTAETQTKRQAELGKALEERIAESETARAEWRDWLKEHGLEHTYDRETAGQVIDAVKAAKTLVGAQRTLETRSRTLVAEHEAYVDQVRALAALLPDGELDEADLGGAVALLAKRLSDAIKAERARDDLARALEERDAAQAEAAEAQAVAAAALQTFLAGSGAEDPVFMRQEVKRATQAQALDDHISAATATLTALSGPGEALQEFMTDLDMVDDIGDVNGLVSATGREIDELRAKRDELNGVAGGLRQSREVMEDDAAATKLRQRQEDLRSRLKAAAHRWSVLALAHDMLARSRAAYEEAHRPAVIEKAERFFEAWTDGRYKRIIAPLGDAIKGAERADGQPVEIAGLSRGTSEQLYLALRFGLVEHFVETSGEPLPIVMDDILVNFDDERASRAARSIEELSKTCQIIYFTCHPTTPLKADLETDLKRMEVN